ncbi:DNA repair protein complementing XP-A cells homolog [Atheta coriaria]|uniref:DNA repair protein complementing XP-A cells homolog n=1 Tax=Dalotia coriaria TaxID=877792 RepID=UPI0031F43DDD
MDQMELTQEQKNRIEKNRQKALLLKKSKLVSHPYAKTCDAVSIDKAIIKVGATKYKDTGGGFLLEEEPDHIEEPPVFIVQEPPLLEEHRPTCDRCEKKFATSWLFETYDCKVCDACKDPEIHRLITKTEAMKEYLLKDCDLDRREPPLKFITKKNPHHNSWGEMKLYLQIQVEDRALEVWGTEEKLEEEIKKREEKKVATKTKKYHKQMKELRMNMRSSLYDKTTAASHTHEFGPESYNEDEDNYTHTCITCKYVETFEKM